MVATLDFESFVASVIRENLVQFEDDAAADAREQQGIAQKGLGNRVISNTPVETEKLPAANNKVSTASRVLTDMSDYYEPDEFPTQEVRVDRAPRFSNINRSTVLDILSANRDGLEKKGIVKMPMGMLREPDPTLDIDGLQSRLLDKLNLRPPEGSPQDIQYGAELGKLGEFRDDYTDIDVDTDAPAGEAQDNQPNVDAAEPSIRVGVKTGLGARPVVNIEDMEPLGEGDAIVRAFFQEENDTSITDADGTFSQDALETALENATPNPYQQALTLGLINVEVGNRGPIREGRYTYQGAQRQSGWAARMNAAGLGQNATGDEIFNAVYANRNGNGDFASGDGSRFSGRGMIQLTGRANYQAVQDRLAAKGIDIDLVANPDLALDNRYALPITLAYLEINGLNSQTAPKFSTKTLNNLINPGASVNVAEERWSNVVEALENAGDETKAREMEMRNEYQAQRTVQTVVDGDIGVNSYAAIQRWAGERNLTVPEVTQITKTYQGGSRQGETYQSYSDEDKIKLAIFVNENA